jgi:CP family cyanate transporter-like MFS transporter
MLAPTLTIPLVLPLVGGSWRLDLALWSVSVLATAILFAVLAPSRSAGGASATITARWWPDWKNPLTWLLGFTFGSNNAAYYGANAFLPDFLAGQDRSDLIGPARWARSTPPSSPPRWCCSPPRIGCCGARCLTWCSGH